MHRLSMLALCALPLLFCGCTKTPGRDPVASLWNEWQSTAGQSDDAKTEYYEGLHRLATDYDLLDRAEQQDVVSYLEKHAYDVGVDEFTIENQFLQDLRLVVCERSIRKGDAEAVAGLIAVACPDYVGLQGIEYSLAKDFPGGAKDGLDVLFMAYTKSAGRQSKCIENAMHRAVWPYVDRAKSMDECRRWLAANRNRLELRPEYLELLLRDQQRDDEPPASLFVLQDGK